MKYARILTLAVILGTAGGAHAQLLVDAPALNLQTKVSWAKQVTDMANQLRIAQEQLARTKATYDSLNGSRGIGALLRNPTLYNYLPQDAASAIRANGGGLASASAIQADLKLFGIDQTSIDPNSPTGKNFTARQAANASHQLLNDQAYQASADRIRQLDALTKSIDGATDPMAINALQVRVNAEQAMLANEQVRLSVLASAAANVERVREQQSREIVMKSTRGTMPSGW